MSLIELKNIGKIYNPGENQTVALQNVNLKIDKNELIAIIGASGSGKSTMLNTLGMLDRPSIGEYYFEEQNVSKLSDNELSAARNSKIGFVFQSFFLITKLTAEQNVMLPLLYRNISTRKASKVAREMLERFGIGHLYHHRPSQLSGGQQQRVALARALIGKPEIILADEPTGALDTRTSQEVMNQFIHLQKEEKTTLIIVTHDPKVADQCHRVVRITDGEIEDDFTHTEEEVRQAREAFSAPPPKRKTNEKSNDGGGTT